MQDFIFILLNVFLLAFTNWSGSNELNTVICVEESLRDYT